MRATACCVLALLLLPCGVGAQAGAAAAPGAPTGARPASGLLLGVSCPAVSRCAPGTFWIVREGDQVRLAAHGSGYLVPRSDGFWWVDYQNGFSGAPDEPEDCQADTSMARDTSETEAQGAPYEAGVIWAARAGAAQATRPFADTVGGSDINLRWIGSDWISISAASTDNQEHITLEVDLLPIPGPLHAAVAAPPDPYDSERGAWGAALEACRRRYPELVSEGTGELQYSWLVRRRPRQWMLEAVHVERFGADDPPSGCAMPRTVSAPILGYDRVTVPWSAIKDVLPGASTAFESPAGDMLVVLEDGVLYAFLPRAGVLGPPVAHFALAGDPVLAQWAVGPHVARWTAEVTPLLQRGPPAFK